MPDIPSKAVTAAQGVLNEGLGRSGWMTTTQTERALSAALDEVPVLGLSEDQIKRLMTCVADVYRISTADEPQTSVDLLYARLDAALTALREDQDG